MVGKHPAAEGILAANDRALNSLRRAIAFSQGQFSLCLVGCNYGVLRKQMLQRLEEVLGEEYPIHKVTLSSNVISLYSTIHAELANKQPAALVILGLESVEELDDLLRTINHIRDEFRKRHPFPMVFWVNDELLRKLRRFAPDFTSWAATPIRFEMTTQELRQFLQDKTDTLFAQILDIGNVSDSKESPHKTLGEVWDYSSYEFRCAIQELQHRGIDLEPELDASLAFVSGLDDYANDKIDLAIEFFQQSLEFWQQEKTEKSAFSPSLPFTSSIPPNPPPPHLLRQGALLFYIGLCYFRLAERSHIEHRQRWQQAKSYFQQCLDVFEKAQRPDLMAQIIGLLAEVLQHLKEWDELQVVADKSEKLHHAFGTNCQLAYDFGFLAKVAVARENWGQASQLARVALWQLHEAKENSYSPPNLFPLLMGQVYRLTLAQALQNLSDGGSNPLPEYHKIAGEQLELASQELNAALVGSDFNYDVYRYIRLLRWLRSLYFESGLYLEAFIIRQKRRSVEQQYGLRAFIGAGRLQPQRHPKTPALSSPTSSGSVALEITASGRQRDIHNLIARVSRADHKLTIIHGPSGVGKSSTVTAGLVPALQQRAIGDQIAVPVVLQVYTDWVRELGKALGNAIVATKPVVMRKAALDTLPPYPATPITIDGVLELLQENARNSIITVLIFDQIEEFFSGCSLIQLQEFDHFLCVALNVAFVKVILSVREDYLHRLLEFKQLSGLEAINENLLDKNIRYQLNNFSREDAKTVIQGLTERSQYHLEPALVDALVEDLSAELGEVRPIELQVVGAQLQDERILSLSKYEQFRPNKLIERYLKELIRDCGPENERAALLVLYLLTDETKKRPFKTRAELAAELAELENVEKLELVLEILVRSGLVVLFPEVPERYQLIHDYLVDLIRILQQDELSLQEQVKKLRQQVQQSELEISRLNSELRHKKQAKLQDNYPQTGSDLLGELKELRKRDEVSRVERDRLLSEIEQQKLQAELIETEKQRQHQTRVNRLLKSALFASSMGMLLLIASIGMAFYQGRKAVIAASEAASVSSQALFTLGKDIDSLREGLRAARKLDQAIFPHPKTQQMVKTALYQATYGMRVREINRLEGHKSDINSVVISPDNLLIASASSDGTVNLWEKKGKKIHELKGHSRRANSVAFSPDSKIIVSGSADGTVRLWNIDGKLLQTIASGQKIVNSVAFSPDGEIIASAGADKTVRLWNRQGKLLKILSGHSDAVLSVAWAADGNAIASSSSDTTVKLWSRDGKLITTLPGSGEKNTVLSVAWSPDGRMLATASWDHLVRLWSRDGKLLNTLTGHKHVVSNVAFSPDGKTIASASWDRTVKLWNLNGTALETLKGHNDLVSSISFSRDGQMLASASRDTNIKLWRWNYMPLTSIKAHSQEVSQLSYSQQGDLLVSASEDHTVKIWSRDGKLLHQLVGHQKEVWDANLSPDGQFLATASEDNTVKLWSREGKLITTLTGHQEPVLSVDWSPNGERIATASADATVKLWSREGKFITTLTGHQDTVNWVSFSPDGNSIASASDDKTVKIWSKEGKLIRDLSGHSRSVFAVVWSNDGKLLASASLDSTAKLWSPEGKKLKTLTGNGESFITVSFSPDSQTIATLSEDKILLWNRQGNVELAVNAEDETFTTLTFTPDGKALVTGSSTGKVVFRDLADTEINKLLTRGCELLQDYLQNNTKVPKSDRSLCS
ncbi:WD-40 repeat-containing protein [Calothrix sp. NIES-4101]|nr:WD-40 repeat-containing protein [Calothrix sp. NIES-4101]